VNYDHFTPDTAVVNSVNQFSLLCASYCSRITVSTGMLLVTSSIQSSIKGNEAVALI